MVYSKRLSGMTALPKSRLLVLNTLHIHVEETSIYSSLAASGGGDPFGDLGAPPFPPFGGEGESLMLPPPPAPTFLA